MAYASRGKVENVPLNSNPAKNHDIYLDTYNTFPDSKVCGPKWVLSAPGGHHVGPMNVAIRAVIHAKHEHEDTDTMHWLQIPISQLAYIIPAKPITKTQWNYTNSFSATMDNHSYNRNITD